MRSPAVRYSNTPQASLGFSQIIRHESFILASLDAVERGGRSFLVNLRIGEEFLQTGDLSDVLKEDYGTGSIAVNADAY
jgi:hypothetical protein